MTTPTSPSVELNTLYKEMQAEEVPEYQRTKAEARIRELLPIVQIEVMQQIATSLSLISSAIQMLQSTITNFAYTPLKVSAGVQVEGYSPYVSTQMADGQYRMPHPIKVQTPDA